MSRPTLLQVKKRVLARLALDYGDAFVQQPFPQLAEWLNDGARRQHEGALAGFKKQGDLSDFMGHPYLEPFTLTFAWQVTQATTKLLASGGADTATTTLREREVLLLHVLSGVYEGMVFRRVPQHQAQLARAGNRLYRPQGGVGLWSWGNAQIDVFFPTADMKAPATVIGEAIYVGTWDDLTSAAPWDQDDNAASPVDERYLQAPMEWACFRILERANQPGDAFKGRFDELVGAIL